MPRSTETPLPVSLAAILQRAFDSSTVDLSGSASRTSKTPIHDLLVRSNPDWLTNDSINPFRPLTWKGHQLYVVAPKDVNPPWRKHG